MNPDKNHQQCLEKLIWAMDQLGVDVSINQLSQIASLIVKTMTGPWRYFHSTDHIFEVGGYKDAIEVLAALFHDIVYVQVDGSVNFNLTYYLAPFIEEEQGELFIRQQDDLPHDLAFEIVLAIFDFVPGQQLSPLAGQNEFLSAVVAFKVLESLLNWKFILQIVACIEATIPFRTISPSGLNPSERLYQRLLSINQQFNLKLSKQEIIQIVKRSVRLANRDVGSFAHPSSAVFLTNTWSLLPETNHSLRKADSYTVRDYRLAMQKMVGFLNFLKPELIFRQFQGEPDQQTYNGLVQQARKNLQVGRLYLESKLVANAILEALSLRLGQDISLAIMMGELPSSGVYIGRLGDSFPEITEPYQPNNELEMEVLDLLAVGRSNGNTYDLKNSPLTTFVVNYIGFDCIREIKGKVYDFFQETTSSEYFLANCNADLVKIIVNEVVHLLENRKKALFHPLPR